MAAIRSLTTLVALALLATACVEPEPEADMPDAEVAETEAPVASDAEVRAQLEEANARFAEGMNRGDVPAAMDVYTDDARIYPPDMATTEGRDGITAFWQGGLEQMGISNVSLTTEEVEVFDDTAWEQGRATFDTAQGPVSAKYIVIWKRGLDGQWRWHRDIWNMDPPADTAEG